MNSFLVNTPKTKKKSSLSEKVLVLRLKALWLALVSCLCAIFFESFSVFISSFESFYSFVTINLIWLLLKRGVRSHTCFSCQCCWHSAPLPSSLLFAHELMVLLSDRVIMTGRVRDPTTCLQHKAGRIPLSAIATDVTTDLAGFSSSASLSN